MRDHTIQIRSLNEPCATFDRETPHDAYIELRIESTKAQNVRYSRQPIGSRRVPSAARDTTVECNANEYGRRGLGADALTIRIRTRNEYEDGLGHDVHFV